MSRARIQLQPAWVLKASAYSDTSLLVEAFTPSHGRIGLIARGARTAKSRPRALLQSFRPLLLSWSEAGDLGTLTGVEASPGAAFEFRGETIFSGWYLNELLLRLLQRHDAHPVLFEAYGEALATLVQTGARALRRFEMVLLAELGFGIDLPPDLDPTLHYFHRNGEEPVPGPADAEDSYSGRTLIALRDDRLETVDDLRAARRLLSGALAEHLGSKGLSTAATLRDLRRSLERVPTPDSGS